VHAAVHVSALTPTPHIVAKDLDKLIATNIRAVSRLIALVGPLIDLSERPQAVFFDDQWDEKFAAGYGMCKAAQRAMVQSWQTESAKFGPKIHLLRPAPMPTAVRARFYPGEDTTALATPRDEAARLLPALLPG
jgi:NAD(P)-dependent dehydrogenase (short-subunit alcohol dehydrogenase family)